MCLLKEKTRRTRREIYKACNLSDSIRKRQSETTV